MDEKLEKVPHIARLPRQVSVGRTIFVSLFAIVAAVVFGFGAIPVLTWIRLKTVGEGLPQSTSVPISVTASVLLGIIVGGVLANLLLTGFGRLGDKWDRMDSGDKVTVFMAALVGLLASTPFLFFAFSVVPPVYFPFVAIVLTLGTIALCTYLLESMADILPWSRGKGKGKRRGIKVLDTNVIIDGRIYDVARTGFLEGQLYVPGFVLDELQFIADSHDPLRRQRGRRGLDVLRHMQSDFQLDVRTMDRLAPDIGDGVDSRLVRLARAIGADIVTNDFNLNRVAALQEVKVLNINDLALGLRPNVLPSEHLTITVIREGNQAHQGVGYLEDGTMVVVENGKEHIGETLDVTVTQVIQTERGKMIFAEIGQPAETNGHAAVDTPKKRPAGKRY